ncbi:MAG: orotate phosphoribosyltransferase [Candidatus Aenigmatarchaeota archaeon]
MNRKKHLIELFHELGAIKYGDYYLVSGKISHYKIHADIVLNSPEGYRLAGELGRGRIKDHALAGVATGGVLFARAVGDNVLSVDPKRKVVEGVVEKRPYALLEDVTTTGGSVLRSIELMRGIEVNYVLVLVDRCEGALERLKDYNAECILTSEDLGIL